MSVKFYDASGNLLTSNASILDNTAGGTNGEVTKAPTSDVLFDALALKAPLASPTFTGAANFGSGVLRAVAPDLSGVVTAASALTLPAGTTLPAPIINGQGARVYHNANQSIPDETWTTLAFNSERFDTDTIHDIVTNNSRLTCKTTGKYLLIGIVTFDVNATGWRGVKILANGAGLETIAQLPPVNGNYTCIVVSVTESLAVNDYVELLVLQSSGAALDVWTPGATQNTEFIMQRVG